ncbi:MAG: hypothetical protein AAGO57_00720, partial [Pseudomonadota bacterium]
MTRFLMIIGILILGTGNAGFAMPSEAATPVVAAIEDERDLSEIRPRARPDVDLPAVHFARAMEAMRDGDFNSALAAAEKAGPVARDVIEWHRLRAGGGRFDEVVEFLDRRSDWPGLLYLRRRSEGSVPFGSRSQDVADFFAEVAPQTGLGSVAHVSALAKLNDRDGAEAAVIRAWRTQVIGPGGEKVFLQGYGELLEDHHEARIDMLLWRGESDAAKRMYPLVDKAWQPLAKARLALHANK